MTSFDSVITIGEVWLYHQSTRNHLTTSETRSFNTSTNGSSVLPFKRPLFAPAVLAGVPVLPAVVQLIEIDGKSVSGQNRDLLCWYGDMQFAPHLLALAGLQSVKVLLKILPEIPIKDSTRREELAQEAQKAVTSHYKPIT